MWKTAGKLFTPDPLRRSIFAENSFALAEPQKVSIPLAERRSWDSPRPLEVQNDRSTPDIRMIERIPPLLSLLSPSFVREAVFAPPESSQFIKSKNTRNQTCFGVAC